MRLISQFSLFFSIQSGAIPSALNASLTTFDIHFATESAVVYHTTVYRRDYCFTFIIHGSWISAWNSCTCASKAASDPQDLFFASNLGSSFTYSFFAAFHDSDFSPYRVERQFPFARPPKLSRRFNASEIWRWSLAHTAVHFRIVGVGGILPLHLEMIMNSIFESSMLLYFAGNEYVAPFGASKVKKASRCCFTLLFGSLLPTFYSAARGFLRCSGFIKVCSVLSPLVLSLGLHDG